MGGQIGTIDVCDDSADVPLPHGNSAG
jgi:hypothetical protein